MIDQPRRRSGPRGRIGLWHAGGMRAPTVAVSRRRLTLATGAQIGGRVLGALLGILVAATLARTLTRAQFGELSLGLTILALAGSLNDLGMSQIAVREMARRPEDRARIAGALWLAMLVMGTVTAILGGAVGFALMPGYQARLMTVLLMATMPVGSIGALLTAAQARLRPELVIIPMLVQNVIWLAVVIGLGAAHAGLGLYGAGALLAGVVQALVIAGLPAGVTAVSFVGIRGLLRELLRLAWPIGLAGMFVTAYYRIDGVILFDYRGATVSAYYSAAYRFLDVLQILPMTVSGVLLPLLARVEHEEAPGQQVQPLFARSVALLLALALPVAVCGAILAPGLVRLIYGSHYHHSVHLLQILLPAFIPICLGYLLTSQLILQGMLRPYIVITFAGAAVNVIANLIAIPRIGAPAAAWTTLATEAGVMTAIAVVVRRRLGLALPFARVARIAIAVAVAAALVWTVRNEPVVVGLAVGIVAYPPLLFGTRGITIAEVRGLLSRRAAASA
jgi:O-antigen/teichoic acid export membrane protein